MNISDIIKWIANLFKRDRDLSAIQKAWEETEHDLAGFIDRTQVKRDWLQAEIDALTESHFQETEEKEKANIFLGNLRVLRTQSINLVAQVEEKVEDAVEVVEEVVETVEATVEATADVVRNLTPVKSDWPVIHP